MRDQDPKPEQCFGVRIKPRTPLENGALLGLPPGWDDPVSVEGNLGPFTL